MDTNLYIKRTLVINSQCGGDSPHSPEAAWISSETWNVSRLSLYPFVNPVYRRSIGLLDLIRTYLPVYIHFSFPTEYHCIRRHLILFTLSAVWVQKLSYQKHGWRIVCWSTYRDLHEGSQLCACCSYDFLGFYSCSDNVQVRRGFQLLERCLSQI